MELPKYFYFRVKTVNHGTAIELEDASNVDVVEVVRCKNCTRQMICFHSDDYFCADGEKGRKMTRKEAIFELIKYRRMLEKDSTIDAEPFDMAIEALEKAAPIPNGNLINFGDIGSPTIKPLERKRGEWIREQNCFYRCSLCGKHYASIQDKMQYNYCPNCGADMRGDTYVHFD